MDGRIQEAVRKFMTQKFGVEYVDMVTEPGPSKILAEHTNTAIVENIEKRVAISVEHHGAKAVAIVAHFGCAGNPVTKEEQIEHLRQAKKTVEEFGFAVPVVLLWVEGDWDTVQELD